MSHTTHRQLQEYFMTLSYLSEVVPNPDLFFKLSPALATKLVLDMHGPWLYRLPFSSLIAREVSVFPNGPTRKSAAAKSALDGFLCRIALMMKPALFIAKERPPVGKLYVIVSGKGAMPALAHMLAQ